MQIQTLVNVKYQVVIPRAARKKIKIKPGQKMNVDVIGEKVILSKSHSKKELKWPNDYYDKLGGIWKSTKDIEKYLEAEDRSWE